MELTSEELRNGGRHLEQFCMMGVPLWIDKLRDKSWAYISERAGVCSQHIASCGDNILYKSKTKGATAEAFNRLCEGIACLALMAKGGVETFGGHWDVEDVHYDWPGPFTPPAEGNTK